MQNPKTTNTIGPVRCDFSTTPATQLNRRGQTASQAKARYTAQAPVG